MQDTTVLYRSDEILITRDRFVVGKTTYATRQIVSISTSAEVNTHSLRRALLYIMILIMLIIFGKEIITNSIVAVVIILIYMVAGWFGLSSFFPPTETYHLIIDTASGKTRAWSSNDKHEMEKITEALTQAISTR